MAFWIYMLRCSDGRYYIGHTEALEHRVAEHQAGQCCDYTRRRRPVDLVWSEQVSTQLEALEGERKLKGWTRAKKEALIRGDWGRISWLAIPPRERDTRASTSLSTNGVESVRSLGSEGCPLRTELGAGTRGPAEQPLVLSEVEGYWPDGEHP